MSVTPSGGFTGADWAAIIAAVGSVVTSIISGLNRRTNRTVEKKVEAGVAGVEAVHSEVKTSNGHTLGQIIEAGLPTPAHEDDDKSPAPG